MQTEAERMVRLVRDLLHLSRVEAQERQRPGERHDIARLIQSAIHSLRPQAEAADVRIVASGLDQPVELFADPDQRGKGVGAALIEAVRREAAKAGVTNVYWMTHETNTTARRLYDRVARRTGFIEYDLL